MLNKIRSKMIMNLTFKHLKNKRKLNIIKYNNTMLNRLHISNEDFKIYEKIKEFNEKYKTNIEDIDIKELDLSKKNLGDKALEDLSKINFKELNSLNLRENYISSI